MYIITKITLFLTISYSICFGQELTQEAPKQWNLFVKSGDRKIEKVISALPNNHNITQNLSEKELAVFNKYKHLISKEPQRVTLKEVLQLKKVRSIQMSSLGIFDYPFFSCGFKQATNGLFFEKISGSQRKSGMIFPNNKHSFVFLGAATVNNEPQREYSGFTKTKNTEYDACGVLIKRNNIYLMIMPRNGNYEIYEFK